MSTGEVYPRLTRMVSDLNRKRQSYLSYEHIQCLVVWLLGTYAGSHQFAISEVEGDEIDWALRSKLIEFILSLPQ